MKDLTEKVEGLNEKINHLIKRHQQALEERDEADQKYQELALKAEEKDQEIHQIKEKKNALAVARSFAGDKQDSTELKLKINELVRDLDKCIAMLNQ